MYHDAPNPHHIWCGFLFFHENEIAAKAYSATVPLMGCIHRKMTQNGAGLRFMSINMIIFCYKRLFITLTAAVVARAAFVTDEILDVHVARIALHRNMYDEHALR